MNFGPLEFAAYLQGKDAHKNQSAAVAAARDAAPVRIPVEETNELTIISGPQAMRLLDRGTQIEAVSVYEAVAMRPPSSAFKQGPVHVRLKRTPHPVVLVLSSHQTVEWELEVAEGAELKAVLLSGYGESTVAGAGAARVSSIGGFYAFKRGSAEYRHLEDEVLRCTGHNIDNFQSVYAGHRFEIGE